jgi:hypothetical protein
VIVIIAGVLTVLAVFRYNREVFAIPIETLLRNKPDGIVRILGQVSAGTLVKKGDGSAFFYLSSERKQTEVSVLYTGKPDDNLRDAKALVLTGFFDPDQMQFAAQKISPIPNSGFVVSAYLIALLPLILFLFSMERNLIRLSVLIKEERPYQKG